MHRHVIILLSLSSPGTELSLFIFSHTYTIPPSILQLNLLAIACHHHSHARIQYWRRTNLQRFRHSLHVPLRLDIYYQYNEVVVSDPNGNGKDDGNYAPQTQTIQKRDLLERWCIDYVPSSDPSASSSSVLSSAYGGQSGQGQQPYQQQNHNQQQQQQQQHLPQHSDDILVQLRRVCRRVVVLLRNLHCLTRMMPTYGLHQSLVLGADATKRGLGNLGGVGGYYPRSRHQQHQQQHPLAVPEDLRHHPVAGQIGFALYPSSTDGLRSEAELFGSSNSPFARHEVGSIPTPFGTLHLTGFYDSSLQVNRVMTMRVGRLRTLGLLGSDEEEEDQQRQGRQQLPHLQRGAIAIPQQNQLHTGPDTGTEAVAGEAQYHQSLPSNAMQTAAAAAAASSVPFGASPIIQNYAKSPLHRPHTLGRELPPRMVLNRTNSLPPERGIAAPGNQGVRIGSGTHTPASAGSTPRMVGLEGGENKRVMSGLSLALMNEEAKGDDSNQGGTTEHVGEAGLEPTNSPHEVEEESSVRRRALHHPPPAMYGYGYNNPELQQTSQQPLRSSPPDGSSSAIARSRASSPSPMLLRVGTPTDCLSSTPPFSQGLAMAAAARAGRSGAPDSPGTPGSAASLRRAGLLRVQQQQQGGSGRFTRPSPAGGGMPDKSPPFVNPMSLQAPPTPDSARGQPSSQDTSPGLIRASGIVAAVPPAQLHIPDPTSSEKGGGSNLLPPLSSLDILRTSPFKVSGSSMAAGMGSAAAFASSQQQGSVHNQQISGSGNVGFSLLSSLSGTGASPYSTPYGSGLMKPSVGGFGDDGPGLSSKMGSAHGYSSRIGVASSALAPRDPINTGADEADEMPFAVETGPSPSFGSSGLGSNIADAQRASQQGGIVTGSGLMAGSTASSQLLVASFAHRCATAGRLKMFDEDEVPKSASDENAIPTAHNSSAGANNESRSQPHNTADDLTSQLADLRAFGASLMAEGPVDS